MEIAERIDMLLQVCTKDDGKPFSYRDIEAMSAGALSSAACWKLHTGRIKNPSSRAIGALSKAFKISADYFFGENLTPKNARRKIAEYRDSALVDRIATRISQLDERARQDILQMIEYVRKAQELDAVRERGRLPGGCGLHTKKGDAR